MATEPQDWASLVVEKLVAVIKRPDDTIAQQNLAMVLRNHERTVKLIDQTVTDMKNGGRG
jgi:hypothetical protein